MLIDWLTLRTQISDLQESELLPLIPYLGTHKTYDIDDNLIKSKVIVDIDRVRSDFIGMVWSITSNGKEKFLNIGASPASIMHGSNLFGSSDYQTCKAHLIKHAQQALKGRLIHCDNWHPRRIDITENYHMQSLEQVKESLHILRSSDGIRQKTSTAGDTVYFGIGSRYRMGKAYDKHTQSVQLNNKAIKQGKEQPYTLEQLHLMRSILRLELSLGRQWFDEHSDESILTTEFLQEQHNTFFKQFIGDSEVTDMDKLLVELIKVTPSKGLAQSSYDTYLRIKQNGYSFTQQSMSARTFHRHKKYLLDAGLSISDLQTAKIIELRKRKLMLEPVTSWHQLEQLQRMVA